MAKRGWKPKTSDLSLLLFGLQDASLMAENMVIAAGSLGLGNCFLGAAMYMADKFQKKYRLPERVHPFVHRATRPKSSRRAQDIRWNSHFSKSSILSSLRRWSKKPCR